MSNPQSIELTQAVTLYTITIGCFFAEAHAPSLTSALSEACGTVSSISEEASFFPSPSGPESTDILRFEAAIASDSKTTDKIRAESKGDLLADRAN